MADRLCRSRTPTRDAPYRFKRSIEAMRKKQHVHNGDRSHPNLCALVADDWSYEGWRKDFVQAEYRHYNLPSLFQDSLQAMNRKQKAHVGSASSCPILIPDGSAPRLCQPRAKRAKRSHTSSRAPRENTSSKCVVCLKADSAYKVQPCNHCCVCKKCSSWGSYRGKMPILSSENNFRCRCFCSRSYEKLRNSCRFEQQIERRAHHD